MRKGLTPFEAILYAAVFVVGSLFIGAGLAALIH